MLAFVKTENNAERWYSRMLSPDEFRQFAAAALAGERHQKAWIGVVSPVAADRIRTVSGKAVSKIMIESDSIWHSCKKSVHNLQPDDIFHIVDVINTAGHIQRSGKQHQNNEVLEFHKDVNGIITFVAEVRAHFDGWLALITCYRQKKR
jgi:hypothetical protein